ncbi:MAG: alpha-amylase [Bacteroidetes bacterium]|nr:alpha-amylase [Bacteroidota bacterium]
MAPATTPIPEANRWWNDHVFYEVFVRSFYDSDGNGNGDLKGITQKLDYLNDGNPNTDTDLGVTALWLMPIYPSPSYHGYDVLDYRSVNSQYGTMDDLTTLISEAHKRGMKIVLDFVPNHTSDQHPWFVSSSSAADSPKRNWYVWTGSNPGYTGPWGQNVWYEKNGSYYYAVFDHSMPDLNYNNDAVTNEIEDITKFWYNLKVDGFRMDAAQHLIEEGQAQAATQSTKNWWREYYTFQKNLDPGFMTVGEVWTSTNIAAPFADQRLDYCFEFDLAYAILDAVGNGNVNRLRSQIDLVLKSYPSLQYGTFLTNHDQDRVFESLGLDVAKSKAAAGILLTLPGVPYLYYGEEVAMRGKKPDEFIRRPMQWTTGTNAGFTTGTPWVQMNSDYATSNVQTLQADPNSLWNHYRKLIHIRTSSTPLLHGDYSAVSSTTDKVYSFLRAKDSQGVLALHNLQSSPASSVTFSLSQSSLSAGTYAVKELLSGASLGNVTIASGGGFSGFSPITTLDGYGSYVLSLTKQ